METLNCLSPHWGELVLCFIGFVVILYLIFKSYEYTKVEAEVVKISPISCECVFEFSGNRFEGEIKDVPKNLSVGDKLVCVVDDFDHKTKKWVLQIVQTKK